VVPPAAEDDVCLEVATEIGVYEWHAVEDRLIWSKGLLRIYGLAEAPHGEDGFSRLVHPDDRVRVEAETSGYLGGNATSYSHQFRIVRADGSVRFILDRGIIIRDPQGQVRSIRGTNVDVTELAQPTAEDDRIVEREPLRYSELEGLYAEAPLGLAMLDHDLRFVHVNRALAEMERASRQ